MPSFAGSRLALVALLVAGCAAEGGPVRPDDVTFATRECPDESTLDYDTFGEPFLLDWCTGCHSSALPEDLRAEAPEEINFDAFDETLATGLATETDPMELLELMYNQAADGRDQMPPEGGPGEAERELLGEWIACERDRLESR